jgi:hypothetical protein
MDEANPVRSLPSLRPESESCPSIDERAPTLCEWARTSDTVAIGSVRAVEWLWTPLPDWLAGATPDDRTWCEGSVFPRLLLLELGDVSVLWGASAESIWLVVPTAHWDSWCPAPWPGPSPEVEWGDTSPLCETVGDPLALGQFIGFAATRLPGTGAQFVALSPLFGSGRVRIEPDDVLRFQQDANGHHCPGEFELNTAATLREVRSELAACISIDDRFDSAREQLRELAASPDYLRSQTPACSSDLEHPEVPREDEIPPDQIPTEQLPEEFFR